MKLIAGLGNIGEKYKNSRHNIGFAVADQLAARWGFAWRPERLALVGEVYRGGKVLVIKPATYMNLSGQAVRHYADYFQVGPQGTAIVHDDMDLPGCRIRVRKKGGDGGHNGVKSVIEELGTDAFVRFKIGIGHPMDYEGAVLRHVLTGFAQSELPAVAEAVQKTAEAIECWLAEGADAAMNRFNGV
ncbi:MAG: aminoacyl-tRNA hydrolase [Acidaminococcales bacterium]|jgi:PTH1 family peptidyl-tRNA hydrolase|nr:aminoacyl-tRNA hydrolase [Acidaminococcales bacterium]